MTDKEKLDKLIAEIERRITFFKKQSVRKTTTDDNSCALALQGVLCFYDSMQKEPVKIKKGCKYRSISNVTNSDTGNISFVAGKIYFAPEDDTLVSEENGWLCDTSENSSNFELVEEPVSEELEEAATKYMKSENPPIWGLHEGFIAGAKWQKEKMMKEAIEGIARPDDSEIWCNLASFNLKDGDKLKVIAIKED